MISIPTPICNVEEFEKHINSFNPRYEYDDWLKVGFICYNNFEGSDVGFNFWNKYSKEDEDNYEGKKKLKLKYKTLGSDKSNNKISYKQLKRWNIEDHPIKNKYESWFLLDYDNFMIEMNKECMFHTKSQDIIIVKNDYYFRAKKSSAIDYYSKYVFANGKTLLGDDVICNPFKLWLKNIDRRDITDVIFDPSGKEYISKHNIWKGYKYQNTGDYNHENINHFLQHIKNIICNGDEKLSEYVLNWFSQIIQTPHQKTKVGLVWRSEAEGVGKNIILDLIKKIIGSEYYYSTSNLEHLIGNFNADAEAKILINMNECLWGGDKKKEGRLKEFITEETLTINQKQVKTYNIDNYANVVITTNSDWIIGVNKNDRRWAMMECSEKKFDAEYYKKLANTNIQDLTNYFYSRDLSNFKATEIIKTQLHNDQVELNMSSTEIYWLDILTKKHILCETLETETEFKKSHIHEHYKNNTEIFGAHDPKVNNIQFWKQLRKLSPSMKFKTTGNIAIIQPLEILRKEYNEYYKYDKFNLNEEIDFKKIW